MKIGEEDIPTFLKTKTAADSSNIPKPQMTEETLCRQSKNEKEREQHQKEMKNFLQSINRYTPADIEVHFC